MGYAVEDTYASIVTICPWNPKLPPGELPLNYETRHSVESYYELPSGIFYYKPSQTSFENLLDDDPDRSRRYGNMPGWRRARNAELRKKEKGSGSISYKLV